MNEKKIDELLAKMENPLSPEDENALASARAIRGLSAAELSARVDALMIERAAALDDAAFGQMIDAMHAAHDAPKAVAARKAAQI